MHWILLVFALIAGGISAALFWWRGKAGREMGLMAATETSKAGEIAGKPAGTLVELKGTVHVEAPLKGEYSGFESVYYRVMVEREVERVERDAQGGKRKERTYYTDSDKKFFAPARLQDSSGSVALDFEGAEVEAEQTHRRYEQSGLGGVGSLLNVSGTVLGHRYTEWAIRPGTALYVLGTVLADGKVGKAADPKSKNPFIISNRSEEERSKSLGRTQLWTLISGVVLALVAATLLYFAIANWGAVPLQRT